MAILSKLAKYQSFGLLIMRLGLGVLMIAHGYPKLAGGPDKWKGLGEAMEHIGMHYYPIFWGLMAALAEALGGLLILIGFLFRPACLFLVFTMAMAAITHFSQGDDLLKASHAIELGFVFFGLLFIGPGKYSADKS